MPIENFHVIVRNPKGEIYLKNADGFWESSLIGKVKIKHGPPEQVIGFERKIKLLDPEYSPIKQIKGYLEKRMEIYDPKLDRFSSFKNIGERKDTLYCSLEYDGKIFSKNDWVGQFFSLELVELLLKDGAIAESSVLALKEHRRFDDWIVQSGVDKTYTMGKKVSNNHKISYSYPKIELPILN